MKGPKAPSKKYGVKSQQRDFEPNSETQINIQVKIPTEIVESRAKNYLRNKGAKVLFQEIVFKAPTAKPQRKIHVKTPTEAFQVKDKFV